MAKKSFKIKGNLAEALDDTVSSAKNNAGELHIEAIPLRKIALDPNNPRDLALSYDDLYNGLSKNDAEHQRKLSEKKALASMVKSIEEQGVINPIVVYQHGEQYRLIAGERRTLASIMANRIDIPAKVLASKPDLLKLSLIQWVENVEREDLSLWERVRNLEKILEAYAGCHDKEISTVTAAELTQLIGCSLQQGWNYRHLLNSSPELRRYLQSGEIKNIEKVALIVKSPQEIQAILIEHCLNGAPLSELKRLAKDVLTGNKKMKKGRPTSKVNFGSTTSTKAAKEIISSVLDHENFKHLRPKFDNICWDDHRSIATAFKQLIKLLEQAQNSEVLNVG